METPLWEKAQRRIRLGRSVVETLRGMRRDLRADIEQIAEGPQIYEYVGGIARIELDDAVMCVDRERPQRGPKIEQVINANTSVAYIKSNSERCSKPRSIYWHNRDCEN